MASGAGAPLGVRLFGHVALETEGTPFALSSQRSTAPLLAYLVLHRDAPVARDFLAYLLWPDDTEESARLKLRNNLYRLTRSLPPPPPSNWLIAEADSVRWNPDAPLRLDVDEFVSATRDADRREEAVALYRGDLLSTFYDEWLIEPRERYRNLHLTSLTELVSQYRRARDLPRAIAYAQQLLAADPFREDVLRRLIAIRHESGDRAGALWEYQRFAGRLHDELGIDPMPETVALRDAIVRDDLPQQEDEGSASIVVAPAVQTRELPFVGRQAELDQLFDAWSRATRQRGGCVLIGGEAGIGKSRLALEFARMAEDRGARVLAGATGTPEEIPYQCLVEALRSALPLVASLQIGDVWLASLATLLPELRERLPALAAPPNVGPADERARLFEALARAFSALAKTRPLIVVLEDLHWSGESTLAAIEYLLRRVQLLAVLFVATYRDDETPRAHPLRRLRRGAQAEGLVRGLTLASLSRNDVAELSRSVPESEGNVAALYAASDGNPLFLTQLVDIPSVDLASSGAAGLRRLIAGRIEARSAEARTVGEIAALIGTRFSRDAIVDVSGWHDGAVQAALDELIDHRIVQETSGKGFFDYAFTHSIVADVIAAAVPPERAAERHRRIARVLEELIADRAEELSATIARQYDLAGDSLSAAPRYLAAARSALAVGAVDEAESLAARGLSIVAELGLRSDLLAVIEIVAARKGDDDARERILGQLDDIASSLDDDERRRHAALRRVDFAQVTRDREREAHAIDALRVLVTDGADERWTGRLRNAEARHAIAVGELDRAKEAADRALGAYLDIGDAGGEALARLYIAEIAIQRDDLVTAERLIEAARAAADRASDSELSLRLLSIWFQHAFSRRDLPRCLAAAHGFLEAAIASGDRRAEAEGHQRTAVALVSCGGRYADAREHLETAAAIGAEIDDQVQLGKVFASRGMIAETLGDFSAARQAQERHYEIFSTWPEPRQQLIALLNLSSVRTMAGNGAEAKELAQQALDLARRVGYGVLEASAMESLASAEAASGEHLAAIGHMEEALALRSSTESGAWTGVARANLALWYAIAGDLTNARACVSRMFDEEETIGHATPWPQTCYWAAAQVLRLCGEREAALQALDKAQTLMYGSLERIEEAEREQYLSIFWHQDIVAATERGVWPDPPR